MKDYAQIPALLKRVPAERQSAKRHYGVHPYFTRRPHNVVRRYIAHYTNEGDAVLDPFGGSGVTAIEAFLENRTGIQNDINPLANFIADGIAGLADGELREYRTALFRLEAQCRSRLEEISRANESRLDELYHSVHLPPNVALPSNSDVAFYHDLFTRRQITALAILKAAIEELPSSPGRTAMLLAWSATLAKLNRTFLSAEGRAESRGGSSIFSIYRYKIAQSPVELPPWPTFEERALNVIEAKKEIDRTIDLRRRTGGWSGRYLSRAKDIEDLSEEFAGTIDYIFTDPPYGGHISYLDLSSLWNVWLDRLPSQAAREHELIVGGELKFPEEYYIDRLGRSVRACMRMLKRERWMSVVFQHWNTDYFQAILEAAAEEGAELKAAISQVGDPIWSMHKKKNKDSVLAGELILTFFKSRRPQARAASPGFEISQALGSILSECREERLYGEWLFNALVVRAWEQQALGSLNLSKGEFTELLRDFGWYYDDRNHYWVRAKPVEASLFG